MSNPDDGLMVGSSVARRARGPRRESKFRPVLGLIGGSLILLLFAVQIYQAQQNSRLRERIDQSYETREHVDTVLSLHQDIETGQRGFLLTGNPAFLEPYLAGKAGLDQAFRQLVEDFAEPEDAAVISQIEEASRRKIEFSQRVIALRQRGEGRRAVALVSEGTGRTTMDRIRALVAKLRDSEREELSALLYANSSNRWWSQPLSLGLQGLLLILLAAAYAAYLANVRRLERTSLSAQESSARQAAIFDAASDAMIVVDELDCIETFNPAARRLFAFEESQMVGRKATALFKDHMSLPSGPDAGPLPQSAIQTVKGLRADGSDFDAEVSSSTVDVGDRALRLLLVRDATERNRMEQMKSQFVSTVSHELRTPLTSIRGALALLDHAIGVTLETKPRQLLNMAKSNSERLSKLIDDILDVEKLGSRDLHFQFAPVDLRDVVAKAGESNRTFASDRGVRLTVTIPNYPLMVQADESRLLQAFTNLVSNAAKFSPKDGLVNIFAEARGAVARVSVADQGPGIPAEFRPRMFERFSQASRSQQSSNAGTGLGLAITRSIVDRHKGEISYETSLGEGTLFWIELPLAEGAPA